MKIIPREILKSGIPQETTKSGKSSGDKFDEVLQKAIDDSSISRDQPITLPPVQNISNIRFDLLPPVDKAPIIERIEKFLDVLEDYLRKLEDPKATLRETYPLVARMESERDRLLPLVNSLQEGDEIRDILNRALVTSTVEAIKFNRGDYL